MVVLVRSSRALVALVFRLCRRLSSTVWRESRSSVRALPLTARYPLYGYTSVALYGLFGDAGSCRAPTGSFVDIQATATAYGETVVASIQIRLSFALHPRQGHM